jgi:WD40 repeat protein
VILWDATKNTQKNRFLMPDKDRARGVAILPDGNVLAAGATLGQVVEWDAVSGAIRRQAEPPFVPHSDLAVLPDGRRFLTADHDGMVRLWTPSDP